MMQYVAAAAKAARLDAGLSHAHVAAARGVRESTVVRFESGRMQQVNLDEMLDAYASVTGVPAIVLWDRALSTWRKTDESSNTSEGNRSDRRAGTTSTARAGQRDRAAQRA
jgi:transcriptional regulator with XRE-family HTH domain